MKFSHITPILALVLGSAAMQAQPLSVSAAGPKKILLSDKVGKNQFEWTSDAPMEQITGTAEGISGSLTLDPKDLKTLRGTISAQVTTMKSGNTTRDEHMKGEKWLNAAKFPAISFTASSVGSIKTTGNKMTGMVTGNFTMHGVTKTITVPVTLQYIPESSKTRERAPGDLVMLTANFDIALKDFNVGGAQSTVGSKVGVKIQIAAKLFGSTGL
jgi:polyisoprenoid-binding protein YceI